MSEREFQKLRPKSDLIMYEQYFKYIEAKIKQGERFPIRFEVIKFLIHGTGSTALENFLTKFKNKVDYQNINGEHTLSISCFSKILRESKVHRDVVVLFTTMFSALCSNNEENIYRDPQKVQSYVEVKKKVKKKRGSYTTHPKAPYKEMLDVFNKIYSEFNPEYPFTINFEDIRTLIYKNKKIARRLLKERFIEGVDYKIEKVAGAVDPKYMLSIDSLDTFLLNVRNKDMYKAYKEVFYKEKEETKVITVTEEPMKEDKSMVGELHSSLLAILEKFGIRSYVEIKLKEGEHFYLIIGRILAEGGRAYAGNSERLGEFLNFLLTAISSYTNELIKTRENLHKDAEELLTKLTNVEKELKSTCKSLNFREETTIPKLKAFLAEKDATIEALKAEIEILKTPINKTFTQKLKELFTNK